MIWLLIDKKKLYKKGRFDTFACNYSYNLAFVLTFMIIILDLKNFKVIISKKFAYFGVNCLDFIHIELLFNSIFINLVIVRFSLSFKKKAIVFFG